MKHLNMRLERAKRDKAWTQEYVGNQVGLTKTAISDIESGKQKPSYDVLVKLENLFGLSHRYLLAQANDTQQSNCSTSQQDGIAEAKALEEAQKAFSLDVETIADLLADGRIDCPERRHKAQRLHEALGAALV